MSFPVLHRDFDVQFLKYHITEQLQVTEQGTRLLDLFHAPTIAYIRELMNLESVCVYIKFHMFKR